MLILDYKRIVQEYRQIQQLLVCFSKHLHLVKIYLRNIPKAQFSIKNIYLVILYLNLIHGVYV